LSWFFSDFFSESIFYFATYFSKFRKEIYKL
jgi:hypothetical protein